MLNYISAFDDIMPNHYISLKMQQDFQLKHSESETATTEDTFLFLVSSSLYLNAICGLIVWILFSNFVNEKRYKKECNYFQLDDSY